MEVYILDDVFRRITIIDRFESLIWTERYSAFGDFQLVIHSTVQSRSQLVEGTRLAIPNSTRVMTVENVENKDDSEGRDLLTVTGRSLEFVFENRGVRKNLNGSVTDPNFTFPQNTPAEVLRALFKYICVDGSLSTADKIPMYTAGSLYPANTIAEPDVQVILAFDAEDLYKALKEACDVYGLGFRLYKGPDTSKLYFNIYTGNDRTSSQTTLPAVIFSPDLENLSNTSEFRSIEKYKNVALVVAKNGSRWVYANDDAINTSGFDRRVVVIKADDIDLAAGTVLNDALDKRGKDELTKYKPLKVMDGELPSNSKYQYGIDYELGDLVEMRNDDGLTNRMRVTEQIFVDDSSGERSYPALSLDEFITPGTWYAWDSNGVWDNAPGVWAFAGGEKSNENLFTNGGLEMGTAYEWSQYTSSTISVSTLTAEKRTGAYGLKIVTTAVNGGTFNNLTTLAPTPMGAYKGGLWVKCITTNQVFSFKIQEYSAGGSLLGETSVISVTSTGAWQNAETTYTKQQPDSVLRVSIQKNTMGTFFIDDAYINQI